MNGEPSFLSEEGKGCFPSNSGVSGSFGGFADFPGKEDGSRAV